MWSTKIFDFNGCSLQNFQLKKVKRCDGYRETARRAHLSYSKPLSMIPTSEVSLTVRPFGIFFAVVATLKPTALLGAEMLILTSLSRMDISDTMESSGGTSLIFIWLRKTAAALNSAGAESDLLRSCLLQWGQCALSARRRRPKLPFQLPNACQNALLMLRPPMIVSEVDMRRYSFRSLPGSPWKLVNGRLDSRQTGLYVVCVCSVSHVSVRNESKTSSLER